MGEKHCRSLVRYRAGGLCERCGRQGHSIHHRRKRSAGGPWTPTNCVLVCGDGVRGCHGWIENNPNAAADEGFHVRSYQDETTIPIQRHGRIVMLRNDGGFDAWGDHD